MPKVHFFCEHCRKEVRARDKICPHCGKFFSQVRCPECEYQGPAEHFFTGCPQCGYFGKGKIEPVYENVDLPQKIKVPDYLKKSSEPIPNWVFALVGILFFATFVGMIVAYLMMKSPYLG